MQDLVINGRYRHFKGKEYQVIGLAYHSETLEKMIVYQALYDDPKFGDKVLWVRPKNNFLESKSIDGKIVPRFKYITG